VLGDCGRFAELPGVAPFVGAMYQKIFAGVPLGRNDIVNSIALGGTVKLYSV
jgi:hypothetical protein